MEQIIMTLVLTVIISLSLILVALIYSYKRQVESERLEKEKKKRDGKSYVISVTKSYNDGSQITHYHGYNSDKWTFTYEEAVAIKDRIANAFDEVRIMEYRSWMIKDNPRLNSSNKSRKAS